MNMNDIITIEYLLYIESYLNECTIEEYCTIYGVDIYEIKKTDSNNQ